jgi:hypothetical protein
VVRYRSFVALFVEAVDNNIRYALRPSVDSRRNLAGRLSCRAVDSMSYNFILPGKIVFALSNRAGEAQLGPGP